ncbi:hypothetical protein [Wolbachia endosymbiont of Glossina morsitans morsitans]|uniref:hypothetical protein n=1 Tax=Wolbachia endosymbiont of Glossina morsitans morsitans TaxID=1150948 RepID=UPI001F11F1DA|nr:hypothetical protein [Wolbachia endosymbiont of Glossina morsitans morsitans]
MLLACYSHKHISYRIRTFIRKAVHSCTNIVAVIQVVRRNKKTCLTNSASPLIVKLKLFIYLLCTD